MAAPRIVTAAALLLLLSLTGCGFHPVYGTVDDKGTPVSEELNAIAIDNIPDRTGQELRNDLIDRLYGRGRPAQPAYHLTIKLRTNEEDIGLLENATSTLAKIDSYADFTLTDAKHKAVLTGTTHSSSSYDRLNNEYATLAAHNSAVDRTVNELSEQLVNRLGLFFAERPAYEIGDVTQATADKLKVDQAAEDKAADAKEASDKALARKAAAEKAAADHAAGLDSGSWLFGY